MLRKKWLCVLCQIPKKLKNPVQCMFSNNMFTSYRLFKSRCVPYTVVVVKNVTVREC